MEALFIGVMSVYSHAYHDLFNLMPCDAGVPILAYHVFSAKY